jgi:hypothetical protein
VSRATGNGYRIPAEALIKGASPVIEQVSARPSRLVKLSDNPFIPLIKARNLAANCNVEPNFWRILTSNSLRNSEGCRFFDRRISCGTIRDCSSFTVI